MRIRVRASDFGLVAKINIIRAKSKPASYAEMVLGSFIFLLVRVIKQLGFWTRKVQANVDCCYTRRRAECTLLGPGLKYPSLRSDSGREETCRGALRGIFFNKASEPSTLSYCCVYSRMIRVRSHERRAVGALLSLFSRSEHASTDS